MVRRIWRCFCTVAYEVDAVLNDGQNCGREKRIHPRVKGAGGMFSLHGACPASPKSAKPILNYSRKDTRSLNNIVPEAIISHLYYYALTQKIYYYDHSHDVFSHVCHRMLRPFAKAPGVFSSKRIYPASCVYILRIHLSGCSGYFDDTLAHYSSDATYSEHGRLTRYCSSA